MAGKPKKQQQQRKSADAVTRANYMAHVTLEPSVNAAAVVEVYGEPFGEQNISALVDSLIGSTEKVQDGNMRGCEAMLLGQAHALQSIFVNLSLRAAKQEHLNNHEVFLRLALKAQSQCRATLETLAELKNPPVAIVRQANIAHGPQQVNNGSAANPPPADTRARVGEIENRPNQLLEGHHEKRMDSGATGTAGPTDQELAAVGTRDRTKDA